MGLSSQRSIAPRRLPRTDLIMIRLLDLAPASWMIKNNMLACQGEQKPVDTVFTVQAYRETSDKITQMIHVSWNERLRFLGESD